MVQRLSTHLNVFTRSHGLASMKILSVVMVFAVLISLLTLAIQPAMAAACTQYYTVKAGDNLYRIGLKYGVSWTYLASLNGLTNPNKIYAGQVLCVSTSGTPVPTTVAPTPIPSSKIPTFSIIGVVKDTSVTIKTANFPANDTFLAYMGAYGTKGVNGINVGTVNSGAGGVLQFTFNIPAQLKGSYRIAIRLQSPTSGYYSYNWFYNNNAP